MSSRPHSVSEVILLTLGTLAGDSMQGTECRGQNAGDRRQGTVGRGTVGRAQCAVFFKHELSVRGPL